MFDEYSQMQAQVEEFQFDLQQYAKSEKALSAEVSALLSQL